MFVLACRWLEVKVKDRPHCPLAGRADLDSQNMAQLLLLSMLAVSLPAEASEAPETRATAYRLDRPDVLRLRLQQFPDELRVLTVRAEGVLPRSHADKHILAFCRSRVF